VRIERFKHDMAACVTPQGLRDCRGQNTARSLRGASAKNYDCGR